MSWNDRLETLIRTVSPQWAAKREQAREMLAAYRDASRSRLDYPASSRRGRADNVLELGEERRLVMERAREAERTNVVAEALLSRCTEQVVGEGLTLRSMSGSPRWDRLVEDQWREWGDHEADVRGLSTLGELDALVFRSMIRDGDVGVIMLADETLQTFEADQLASPRRPLDRQLIDGIELDRRGKPTKFWVVTDPDPRTSTVRYQKTAAIPAEYVSYLARRQRLGQTRGLSRFAGSLWLLDQIDGNISAITAAARMAACVGLVINRKNPRRNYSTTTDTNGNTRQKLSFEPGSFFELAHEDKVTTLTPSQPTQNFPDFIAALCRFAGLGFGMPLELALMDFTRSNYSQARGALLQAHKVVRQYQQTMKRHKTRIYRWWLINRMQSGRIPYRAKALRHAWTPPARELLDPEKELKAAHGLVDIGASNLSEVAASMGRDWYEVLQQRAEEIREYEKAGVPIARSLVTRDSFAPQTSETPEDEPPGGADADDEGDEA